MENRKRLYIICECAVFVAMATALSFIKIPLGVLGGSVDFVMVPLFIICYRHGFVYGTLSGLCFGFIKCLIGGGIGWGLPSILFDYVLAYGACGVAGLFAKKPKFTELSVAAGCVSRFLMHFISGITIYAIAVPTQVEGLPWVFSNPAAYSLVYNAVYMLPNTVIAIVCMSLLRYPLKKLP